jgi:hypothetical protein
MNHQQRTGLIAASLLALLSGGISAQASVLPEGVTKFDFSYGRSTSNLMWYQDATKQPFNISPRSGEAFQDQQFDLGAARALGPSTEVGLAVGFADKNHAGISSGAEYRTSGVTYLTAKAKQGLWSGAAEGSFSGFDLNGVLEVKLANGAGDPWYFQSPNDRAHHVNIGLDFAAPIAWGVYGFISPKYIYRTHARPGQIEGSAGLSIPVLPTLQFTPYYHYLATGAGTDCFHNPKNYTQFHTIAYGPRLSDRHHGPGASLSYIVNSQFTVDAFFYAKISGVNTDKSTTFGANLGYYLF